MRPARSISDMFSFGGRVPPSVGGIITAIVVASLVGAIGRGYGIVSGAALTLYWFGRDLCFAWGSRRFLATFFGVAIGAAVAACVVALFWPVLEGVAWASAWAPISALIVAWSMIFPERQILFMMALPISGRTLLWLTLGGTLLYAVFDGLHLYVPHLAAQGLMMAYARGWSLRGFWQNLRIKSYERRARRRASHLKVVKKEDPPRWMN